VAVHRAHDRGLRRRPESCLHLTAHLCSFNDDKLAGVRGVHGAGGKQAWP
jgi:hypothetical protein